MRAALAVCVLAWASACEGPPARQEPRAREERRSAPRETTSWTGGFTAGGTVATLRDECEAAGHDWNEMSPEDELPIVHAWLDAGLVARCSGIPRAWAWGRVVQANFQLYEGRSVGMTFYVDGEVEDVREELERIAQDRQPGPNGRVIYMVDRDATEHEPITVSLSPAAPSVEGARFGLTYTSRAGIAAPPLPESEDIARAYLARERAEGRALPE